MIYLPKNYRDWVQVREFVEPLNSFSTTGLLYFLIKNDSGQLWQIEKPVQIAGFVKAMNTHENYQKVLVATIEKAYDDFVRQIRDEALAADRVFTHNEGLEPDYDGEPLDNNWYPVWSPILLSYADYLKSIK